MEKTRDYHQDIADIKAMMNKSSKFLSISGWSGVMAGIYALIGAYVAHTLLPFNAYTLSYNSTTQMDHSAGYLVALAMAVLLLAVGTAIYLSGQRAKKAGEKSWNPTSKRLILQMAIPLFTGGILMVNLLFMGLTGLLAPLSLVFYGLAIYQAGQYSYKELKILGLLQILLGLISSIHLELSLLYWAFGFGFLHIIYGLLVHLKYQR